MPNKLEKWEKVEKSFFFGSFPGLKSEFLRAKTLENFIYANTLYKKPRKKIASKIYPGYQIRGLAVN